MTTHPDGYERRGIAPRDGVDPVIVGLPIAFELHGEHFADRLVKHQSLRGDVILKGDPPPTPNQIAAVLDALSNQGFTMRLVSEDVAAMGRDRRNADDAAARSTGLGRFLKDCGRWIETYPSATGDPSQDPRLGQH